MRSPHASSRGPPRRTGPGSRCRRPPAPSSCRPRRRGAQSCSALQWTQVSLLPYVKAPTGTTFLPADGSPAEVWLPQEAAWLGLTHGAARGLPATPYDAEYAAAVPYPRASFTISRWRCCKLRRVRSGGMLPPRMEIYSWKTTVSARCERQLPRQKPRSSDGAWSASEATARHASQIMQQSLTSTSLALRTQTHIQSPPSEHPWTSCAAARPIDPFPAQPSNCSGSHYLLRYIHPKHCRVRRVVERCRIEAPQSRCDSQR